MTALPPIEIDILLQRPIAVNIIAEDGTTETVMIPRLGIEGMLPWLDELTAKRQAAYRLAASKQKLDARTAIDAEFSASQIEGVVSDLSTPVQTPKGIRRVITMAVESPAAQISKPWTKVASTEMMPIPPERIPEIVNHLMLSPSTAWLSRCIHCLFVTGEARPEPETSQTSGPLAGSGASGPSTNAPASTTTG